MIVLNPFLDSLCNFGFKNIGLTPGIPKGCFQHPQDVVIKDVLKEYAESFFGEIIESFWRDYSILKFLLE